MSTLMFWNKQNGNSNQNGNENGSSGGGGGTKNGKKTWLHSPESLVNGHVAYLVKVSGRQQFPFPAINWQQTHTARSRAPYTKNGPNEKAVGQLGPACFLYLRKNVCVWNRLLDTCGAWKSKWEKDRFVWYPIAFGNRGEWKIGREFSLLWILILALLRHVRLLLPFPDTFCLFALNRFLNLPPLQCAIYIE